MSRARFMAKLKEGLTGLPQSEIDEIASDYEFHFSEAAATGQSEDEIVAQLGDPGRLARELFEEAVQRRSGTAAESGPISTPSRSRTGVWLLGAVALSGAAIAAYYGIHSPVSNPNEPVQAAKASNASPKIEISGGQILKLGHIEQNALDIVVDGTGGASAEGHVKELTLRIDGSGKADLGDLKADSLHVELVGTGEADVAGLRTADITITGSGTVRLKVKPGQLNKTITGSGRIIFPD